MLRQFGAPKDAPGIDAHLPIGRSDVGRITDQSAGHDVFALSGRSWVVHDVRRARRLPDAGSCTEPPATICCGARLHELGERGVNSPWPTSRWLFSPPPPIAVAGDHSNPTANQIDASAGNLSG